MRFLEEVDHVFSFHHHFPAVLFGVGIQLTIGVKAHYGIEFLSGRFDKLSKEEQDKVIIHELMHIPKSFGGGFRHHDYVCDKNINNFHKELKRNQENENKSWW